MKFHTDDKVKTKSGKLFRIDGVAGSRRNGGNEEMYICSPIKKNGDRDGRSTNKKRFAWVFGSMALTKVND